MPTGTTEKSVFVDPRLELRWSPQGYLLSCESCGQSLRRNDGPDGYRQEDLHAGRAFIARHRNCGGPAAGD